MWVALALVTALFTAFRDTASKEATRGVDSVTVALGIAMVPALGIGAIVIAGDPAMPTSGFLLALAISGGINAVTTPLVVYSLRRSDMSLVAPLTSLTPLFMVPTAGLVLGEWPSPLGVAGVLVIVAGAYLLNVSDRTAGHLAPILALARDPGARAMLAVAFLWSISATFDKVGTQASSPLLWAAAIHAVVAVTLAPLAARNWLRRRPDRAPATRVPENPVRAPATPDRAPDAAPATPAIDPATPAARRISPPTAVLLAGAFTAVAAAAQMTALTMTLAAYVIAVKRTSTLFGVLLGAALFAETRTRERLLGAAIMLAGFVLLTVGGAG